MKRYIIILLLFASVSAYAQTVTLGMRNDSVFTVNNGVWTYAPRGAIFAFGHLLGLEVLRQRNDSLFVVINGVWTYKPNGTTYVFGADLGTYVIGMDSAKENIRNEMLAKLDTLAGGRVASQHRVDSIAAALAVANAATYATITTVNGKQNALGFTPVANTVTVNKQPLSANVINKAIVANTSVTTGTANRTISAAEIVAGNIQQLTGTVNRTLTFDTGTNMSTAASPVTVGDTYYILIKSSGTSSGTITLAGATGMTLSSSAVIAIGTSRVVAIINTGSNAWSVY